MADDRNLCHPTLAPDGTPGYGAGRGGKSRVFTDQSAPIPPAHDDGRVCVNCGKTVDRDRERLCNHCGLPFRSASAARPTIEEPGSDGRLLLKLCATLAVILPPLGPLSSLSTDPGTLAGFLCLVIAAAAAVAFAWRRPLPGGILVAGVGSVAFIADLVLDAAGAPDPSSRYWLFWLFPGGLVGGALFLAAAFWKVQAPAETAGREGAAGLGRRVRREALGIAVLMVVELVFLSVMASYPSDTTELLPNAVLLGGSPLLLVGAGVLGYREDRVRGSFVVGFAAAVVAIAGMAFALAVTGHDVIRVGEGEWIGEAFRAAGLAIVGGGFLGLLGGGVAALLGARPGGTPRDPRPAG